MTQEEIEETNSDPQILSMIDQLVSVDPNKYFYALAKRGAKLPQGFDVSTIVEKEIKNPFSFGMPSSQQTSNIPLGTTTHMTTTTAHIPSISTYGNKEANITTQGQSFTNTMGKTFTNPLFQHTNQDAISQGHTPLIQNTNQGPWSTPQNTNQGSTSQGLTPLTQNANQGPKSTLHNTNQGSSFQFQGAPSSSQNPPTKSRRVHIVSRRNSNQNANEGSIPSLQNTNQGALPSFQNPTQ